MEDVIQGGSKFSDERAPGGSEGASAQDGVSRAFAAEGILEVLAGTLLTTLFAMRAVGEVNQSLFLWPVSAVALALSQPYWRLGWKQRIFLKIGGAAGLVVGAMASGMPLRMALTLAPFQCLDVFLGRLILGPDLRCFNDLKKAASILRFVTMTIVVPLVTGPLASIPLSHFLKQSGWQTAATSILANSLGFAVVVPAVFFLKGEGYRGLRRMFLPETPSPALAAAFFVAVSSLVFWQNKGPFLFMIFPPMVLVLLTMGLEGAVFSSLTLSVIGWFGTSHGHGPIWLMKATPLEHLLALQSFVWVCLVSALPIGGLLDERRQAVRDMEEAITEKSEALEENQRLFASLKTSNDRFLAFMSHGPFASYIKDAEGKMLFYNKFFSELCGVTEAAWIGLKDEEIWPAEMAVHYRRSDLSALETGKVVESDDVTMAPDGTSVFWKTFKFPYYDTDTQQSLVGGVSFDVTGEVWREAALEDALREKTRMFRHMEESQSLLENFLHHNPNLTYIKDDEGKFIFYNREVEKFFGISATEWIGKTISEVRPQAEADIYMAQDRQALSCGCKVENIDALQDREGVLHHFKSVKFAYRNTDGRMMLAKISQDVTSQLKHERALAEANRRLELLATTDSLTGLARRRVFEERSEIEFAASRRKPREFSILMMDIDNFKHRNDTFGHAAGDEALKVLANVLHSTVRLVDLAARLGGEEFAVLLPETGTEGAMILAERIQSALAEADHGPVPLTISIGIAALDAGMTAWQEVLTHADEAMYEAKRRGKNRVVSYEEQEVGNRK